MKRTIITLLALLSLSVMVPAAYAQEYIPEVSTLTGAGAFCGGCGGTFDAEGVVFLWTISDRSDTLCRA